MNEKWIVALSAACVLWVGCDKKQAPPPAPKPPAVIPNARQLPDVVVPTLPTLPVIADTGTAPPPMAPDAGPTTTTVDAGTMRADAAAPQDGASGSVLHAKWIFVRTPHKPDNATDAENDVDVRVELSGAVEDKITFGKYVGECHSGSWPLNSAPPEAFTYCYWAGAGETYEIRKKDDTHIVVLRMPYGEEEDDKPVAKLVKEYTVPAGTTIDSIPPE